MKKKSEEDKCANLHTTTTIKILKEKKNLCCFIYDGVVMCKRDAIVTIIQVCVVTVSRFLC